MPRPSPQWLREQWTELTQRARLLFTRSVQRQQQRSTGWQPASETGQSPKPPPERSETGQSPNPRETGQSPNPRLSSVSWRHGMNLQCGRIAVTLCGREGIVFHENVKKCLIQYLFSSFWVSKYFFDAIIF